MIVNTWDQNVAAGGDRLAIYYRTSGKWRSSAWQVTRFRDGREVATDPNAHWEDKRTKTFDIWPPVRENKPKQLAAAIAWAVATYGPREFVRNRMGDYVERDVNDRFPIPRRDR